MYNKNRYTEIKKIAIVNRGEIAIRLISICDQMGIKSVLLYSTADHNSKAVRLSPESICIGSSEPHNSYLNIPSIIEGALSSGADAIHPGYGFLSENAEFAKACDTNNLQFIGPPVNCLSIFGNKISSREQAIKCGIPVLPAYTGKDLDSDTLLQEAVKIGFPVMIKALHGGGGRGLRIVSSKEEWHEALISAQRETKSSFGSSEIFIEKYLGSARHIEVQIFADVLGHMFYLFDRDCSIQRKHQKIIEEAPACLPSIIKQEMQEASIELLHSVGYLQAGTVEFLYDSEAGKFYFIEVNPRIQVECPITEMILGVDLIRAQILTAQGQAPFIKKVFQPRGHSIQCRIYAENMQKQLPVFGKLGTCDFPMGVNWRFDMGYESGDIVSEYYDAMLGKLITWGENRTRCLETLKHVLGRTILFGLKTNISFLQDLISHQSFLNKKVYTRFVEEVFLKSWKEEDTHLVDSEVISILRKTFSSQTQFQNQTSENSEFNPWKDFV